MYAHDLSLANDTTGNRFENCSFHGIGNKMNEGIKYELKKVVSAKLVQLINRMTQAENEEG